MRSVCVGPPLLWEIQRRLRRLVALFSKKMLFSFLQQGKCAAVAIVTHNGGFLEPEISFFMLEGGEKLAYRYMSVGFLGFFSSVIMLFTGENDRKIYILSYKQIMVQPF